MSSDEPENLPFGWTRPKITLKTLLTRAKRQRREINQWYLDCCTWNDENPERPIRVDPGSHLAKADKALEAFEYHLKKQIAEEGKRNRDSQSKTSGE